MKQAMDTGKPQAIKPMTDVEIDRELARMGKDIASQPKEAVRLPLDPLADDRDQVKIVIINGHRFNIPRGVTVELPACVIEVLKHSGNL